MAPSLILPEYPDNPSCTFRKCQHGYFHIFLLFTKAAGRYESNHDGIYEMCKKDYPDPQAFFDSVKRCLRPNGRLILRDVTSDNKVLVWLMNTLEMPLANICGHGDVQVPTRDVVIKCCKKAGLKVEKFEIRKGMRMHCVVRKPMGKAIGNER